MENVLQPSANMLIPLGLTAAVSAADQGVHIKSIGSETTTLVISSEEMKDLKIVRSLGDSEY